MIELEDGSKINIADIYIVQFYFGEINVICLECNKEFKSVNNSHIRSHGITVAQYKEKYPNSCYFSIDSSTRKVLSRKINDQKFDRKVWNKGLNKDIDSRLIKTEDVWNKGLSKESDSRIKRMSKKCSVTAKERGINKGERNGMYQKSIFSVWVEKYGETKAKELESNRIYKLLKTNSRKDTKNCKKLIEILKKIDQNIVEEYHMYDHETKKHSFYDVYSPKFNMLFESDGKYWHCKDYYDKKRNIDQLSKYEKEAIHIDEYKNKLALKNGYRLIRVWAGEEDFLWNEIFLSGNS